MKTVPKLLLLLLCIKLSLTSTLHNELSLDSTKDENYQIRSCSAVFDDKILTGSCYSKLECSIRGGMATGTCSSDESRNVCCVFIISDCNEKVKEKTVYFRNKLYPNTDSEPLLCQLKIKPSRGACWIRFDYENVSLTYSGNCGIDSIGILDSPDGQSGRMCGNLSVYSTVSRAPTNKDLTLAIIAQGPSYLWNIKISQIRCDEVNQIQNLRCGGRNTINITKNNPVSNDDNIPMSSTMSTQEFENMKNLFTNEDISRIFDLNTPKLKQVGNQRILNGTEIAINEFPWMVGILYKSKLFCGATLISDEWVMTAAHCVTRWNEICFDCVRVTLGDHSLYAVNETSSTQRRIVQIVIHHMWSGSILFMGDIALLRLESPVTFSRAIQPVCLPSDPQKDYEGHKVTAIGWGFTENWELPDIPRKVQLEVMKNQTCFDIYKPYKVFIKAGHVCTQVDQKPEGAACYGDSGGPLVAKDVNGKFTQIGIVSFGAGDCRFFPSVFTRIPFYVDWIQAALTDVQ